jgi:membrane protease YdiL (CAAX protease family)
MMALLFSSLGDLLGPRRGYAVSFAAYWVFWCLAFPVLVLGAPAVLGALRPTPVPGGWQGFAVVVGLLAPPVGAGLTVFRKQWRSATSAVLLLSAGIALLNGVGEELLWRGAYMRQFHDNPLIAIAYPAVGFALWHLAPLIARPTRQLGGPLAFVSVALLLGLLWGWVAFVTGSIALTAVSHVLTDFLGLGGFAYDAGRPDAPEAQPIRHFIGD